MQLEKLSTLRGLITQRYAATFQPFFHAKITQAAKLVVIVGKLDPTKHS